MLYLLVAYSALLQQSPPANGPSLVAMAPKGTLIVAGGGAPPPEAVKLLLVEASSRQNHIIVIPTASLDSDSTPLAHFGTPFTGKVGKVTVLHAKTREEASSPAWTQAIQMASAVWISGGDPKRLSQRYAGTPVEKELKALLSRGGCIGGTSAGAAIMSPIMIASGNIQPEIVAGFGFLQRVIIDQYDTQRMQQPRLQKAVINHPGTIGLGIEEQTAVIFKGREIHVVGQGKAHGFLPSYHGEPTENVMPAGTRDDLVRLMRMADAPKQFMPRGKPVLTKGSVMAVGGGGMGTDLARRFVELSGGGNALIVVLPTAAPDESPISQGNNVQRLLRSGGASRFKVLTGTSAHHVESAEYLDALAGAGGVWFGGGRQWRFVDAYEGTAFEMALRGVLERGGVIGGSSAGATILGDYLCRGSPMGNTRMMTPGYERGFAFLPGVGIDQHFSQRKRYSDMEAFCQAKPEFVGVGIDEATALVVSPKGADVMGPGKVHVYQFGKPTKTYAAGASFSLVP